MKPRSGVDNRVLLFGLLLILAVLAVLNLTDWAGAAARSVGAFRLNRANQQPDETARAAFTAAAAALSRAIALDPTTTAASRLQGYALLGSGRESDAAAAWRNVRGMADELVALGRSAEERGDRVAAATWYEQATQVQPDHADAWFLLGMTYVREEKWDEAETAFATGLELPALMTYGRGDFAYYLGLSLSEQKPTDWSAVVARCDQAIASDDFRSDWVRTQTRHLRGEARWFLGHLRKAADDFAWVIARRPDDYWARVRLGTLSWTLDGDADEAERLLRQAIELRPDLKWAYRDLGSVLGDAGRTEDAAGLYRTVLVIDPQDSEAAAFFAEYEPQK
jgi:tetratricopeptide (TPR) repeat protein